MLTTLKRGSGSILRSSRPSSSFFTVVNKPSPFISSLQAVQRSAEGSRWLSNTPQTQYYGGAQGARRQPSPFREYQEILPTKSEEPPYSKFQELADAGLVDPKIIDDIIKGMGHETMTPVQARTIVETLKGKDTIAQARTGTGKTLGFLIPVVQNIIKKRPELAERNRRMYSKARPSDIQAIIISPTRELAEQIAVEARKVTRNTGVIVQVAVGGNSKMAMLRQMQREGCHLLVATPGRLNDLLTDEYNGVQAPDLSTLVLDEADRLLDGGFSEDIKDIIHLLPDIETKDRQTMMFSATVPKEVMGLVRDTLKPDFQFVQTILKGELATHERVPQKLVEIAGMENMIPALIELCKREIEQRQASPDSMPFKAIVYFNSTSHVELSALVIENLRSAAGKFGSHPLKPAKIFEMHGKLRQEKRTYVSEGFRRAESAIMLSSDVTARGMDFPNVTHVIQMGIPVDPDTYVHRIGRTGRAGKEGQGWLFVVRPEIRHSGHFLRGLPIKPDNSLETASIDMTRDAQLPAGLAEILTQVGNATKMAPQSMLVEAYLAALRSMRSIRDKQLLVDIVNQWTKFGWGAESPPSVPQSSLKNLGIGNCVGLSIGSSRFDDVDEMLFGGGGRGRRGSSSRDSSFGGRGQGRQSSYAGYGTRNTVTRSSQEDRRSFARY